MQPKNHISRVAAKRFWKGDKSQNPKHFSLVGYNLQYSIFMYSRQAHWLCDKKEETENA